MNQHYFVDLHIHIGSTRTGKPVKITASRELTLTNILEEASARKGLDIIGVIDCHVPEVMAELQQLVEEQRATLLQGGGVGYGKLTLLLGTEMEIYDRSCQGPIHVLCFLPTLEEMQSFSCWMSTYQKNITLSSQRSYVTAKELQRKVRELEGLFIPAHIFTPFKSVYGKGVKYSLEEILEPEWIDAVELGLSADTAMADQIEELHRYTFLSNSDAHSLAKIGREYQLMALEKADFEHLRLALHQQKGQSIIANYGLDPELGKYHLEVTQRLKKLTEVQMSTKRKPSLAERVRPAYVHQVPLEYIPQLGRKTLEQLIVHCGSEMDVIHRATKEELEEVVRPQVAELILAAREGKVNIQTGGRGVYGKVSYHYKS